MYKSSKRSIRERLDSLSAHRLDRTTLECTSNLIGQGRNGQVVHATLTRAGNEKVVVKKLSSSLPTVNDERFQKKFVHELEILASVSHENIVRFLGFIEDFPGGVAWIVLSWATNGNIRSFLAVGKWEIPERISLIDDVFKGLNHLHTHQPPICHGDLKSLNILVSSEGRAMLTDFGSAFFVHDHQSTTSSTGSENLPEDPGKHLAPPDASTLAPIAITVEADQLTLTGDNYTLRWVAPEVLMTGESSNLSSDIWSAGWVCWEIMTSRLPFEDIRRDTAVILKIIKGLLPPIREDTQVRQVIALASLMMDCWNMDPTKRPNAAQCSKEISWMPATRPQVSLVNRENDSAPPSIKSIIQMSLMHQTIGQPNEAKSLLWQTKERAEAGEGSPEDLTTICRYLGDVYLTTREYTTAEDFYIQAKDFAARIGDDKALAMAVVALGQLFSHQDKPAQAKPFVLEARDIYARIGDEKGRADTLVGLGCISSAEGNLEEALNYFTEAQAIYAQLEDRLGQAQGLESLGGVYKKQNMPAEARRCFIQAGDLYEQVGDFQGQTTMLVKVGKEYYQHNQYSEAAEWLVKAENSRARIGSEDDQTFLLHSLGDILVSQARYSEAEDLYAKAQQAHAREGDEKNQALALRKLGQIRYNQSKYAAAEAACLQALQIHERLGVESAEQAMILETLADIHLDQSQYSKAEEFATKSYDAYTRVGDYISQAGLALKLGRLHFLLDNHILAEVFYEQAHSMYSDVQDEFATARALAGLGEIYHARAEQIGAE